MEWADPQSGWDRPWFLDTYMEPSMDLAGRHSQLIKLAWALSVSIGLMVLASSTPVQYAAHGQVLPDVTPRGTSPLPPSDPTPTPKPNVGIVPAPTEVATQQAAPPGPTSQPGGLSPRVDAPPNNQATPPAFAGSVPGGFEPPARISTSATLRSGRGAPASITVGESKVTVSWPEDSAILARPVAVNVASVNGQQRTAATDKGLLPTNIAFSLRSGDKSAGRLNVSVNYSDSQTAGIKEESLSTYVHQDSAWKRLDSCTTTAKDNLISCNSPIDGTFMVAGLTPATGVTSSSGGADKTARPILIAASAGVGGILIAGTFLIYRLRISGRA